MIRGEQSYRDLVTKVMLTGFERPDRTGTGTKALFGQSIVSSLKNPVYLILAVVVWGGMYWASKQFCKKHDI